MQFKLTEFLQEFIDHMPKIYQVRKNDLNMGDCVLATTQNSDYLIYSIGNGNYIVSGGWFARKGMSPIKVAVTGCTHRGKAISTLSLVVMGLKIEFGNGILTSPVQGFTVFRGSAN